MKTNDPPKTYHEAFQRFCTQSSVRGLKRIYTSRTRCWQVIWTVAIVGFMGATIYNLVILLKSYFSYNTVTLSVTDYKNFGPFPSITICNTNPFSGNSLKKSKNDIGFNISNYQAYLDGLKALNRSETALTSELFERLKTKLGYYQNLHHDEVKILGPSREPFIFSCKMQYFAQSKTNKLDCGNVTEISDPHHFTCFRIAVEKKLSDNITSIQVVLYLDNHYDISSSSSKSSRRSDGAKVVIHEHLAYPDVTQATDLDAGLSGTFRYQAISWERLPYPYSNCAETLPNETYSDIYGSTYRYTLQACNMICKQKLIIEKCGCLSPSLPVVAGLVHTGLWYCASLKYSFSVIEKNLNCVVNVERTFNKLAATACPYCQEPCRWFEYDLTYRSVDWPPDSYQIAFYNENIKGKSFARRFAVYEEIEKLMITDPNTAWQKLRTTSLIRDNFIRVSVVRDRNGILREVEKPQTSSSELVARLGGIFSLFLGITVISIIEISELIYELCRLCVLARKEKKNGVQDEGDKGGETTEDGDDAVELPKSQSGETPRGSNGAEDGSRPTKTAEDEGRGTKTAKLGKHNDVSPKCIEVQV